MTRRSTRLHQFKQRFERSSEVLQRTRQAGRQQQRAATRQNRMNANRDIDFAPSSNDTASDSIQMPKMDRRQKLRIWQKAREEQRVHEQENRVKARPPFVVGKARSPFRTVEQFIKGPRRRVLSHRNSNLSHSTMAKKPAGLASATTDRPSTVPTFQVVGHENTQEHSTNEQEQQEQQEQQHQHQQQQPQSGANEEDAQASNFAPRSLHSVFEREQHAQDLTSLLVGLQVASPKPCQLSQRSHNDSSNTTITTTISAREEASLLLDDALMQDEGERGAQQEPMSGTAQDGNPVQRFVSLHDKAKAELVALCATWRDLLAEAKETNSEMDGEINRAVGQAELLLRKLMPKYLELCHNATNDTATVRLDDLQGYWDARVETQVMDIKAMFSALDEMRANGWQKKEATPEPAAPKKRRAKKKVVRKPRKTRASSGVAAFLAKKRAEKRSASTASPQIELAVAPRTATGVAPQPIPPPELEKAAEAEAEAAIAAKTTPGGVLQRRKHARVVSGEESDEEQENLAVSSGPTATITGAASTPATSTTDAAAAALLTETQSAVSTAALSDEEGAAPVTPLYSGKRRSVCNGRRNRSMLLTPVRASKIERENLGTEVVFTPVRRSQRTTPSKYRTRSAVVEFSQALEQPNFAYKPNPALDVRTHPEGHRNDPEGANAEPVCTPLNTSTRSRRRRRSSGVHNASGSALRALTPNSNLDALLTCETPHGTPARVSSVAPSPNVSRTQAAPSTPKPCTSTPLFLSARKRPSRAQPALACITEGEEPSPPTDSSSSRTTGVSAPFFDLLA